MQIFVQGQAVRTVNVFEETTVEGLKALLSACGDIPAESQSLFYGGVPLEDEQVVSEIVPELATVTLTARVLGGKVHGSLARAGKVRGQTPKVEPQEKKKKKTGRAKRRMQYNRRFSNVVPTFGRRRGPNSNTK